jgi:hypothetical protein
MATRMVKVCLGCGKPEPRKRRNYCDACCEEEMRAAVARADANRARFEAKQAELAGAEAAQKQARTSDRPMDHMSFDAFMVGLKAAGFESAEQWIREHGGAE